MRIILAAVLILASFVGGFAASTSLHGSWMITRVGGKCAAFDPSVRKVIGTFDQQNGHCNSQRFIWKQLLGNRDAF